MAIDAGGKLAVGPAEAAVLASVAERTIWDEIARGRLKSFKLGRRRLIRVAELDAFLERRERLATTPSPGRAPRVVRAAGTESTAPVPFPHLDPVRRSSN